MPYFYFIMNKSATKKVLEILKECLIYVIIIVVVLLVKTYVASPILVSGDSMDPTLHDKDMMILNKLAYRNTEIERFDIVVIKHKNSYIIKRIIALPGETVEIKDNELYINDKIYTQDFLEKSVETEDFEKVEVKEGYYFVLGDNREVSLDSRSIGLIKKDKIKGKATFTIFPFNRWGIKE